MSTITTAVVLPALFAGIIVFCLVCLVCGLCCCSSFWSVCFFSLSSLLLKKFFCFFSCSCLRGKEETLFLSVYVVDLCPFCVVRSPCEVLVS